MDVREFPVLAEEDQELVDRLSLGLGTRSARVLAYLLCRRGDPELDDAAPQPAVRIGSGETAHGVRDALSDLESADLVAETTAETTGPGRPQKAWSAAAPRDETIRRVYERHAGRLIRQSDRVRTQFLDAASADDAPDRPMRAARASEPTGASAKRDSTDRVSVGLNWEANVLHLPLFAARADNDRSSSVSASFDAYAGSRAAITGLVSGESDVCVAGAATVLREVTRGRSILPLAVLFQRSTVVLYTTREAFGGPFETLEQLRGRRIGMPAKTETGLLGRLLLEQAGLRDAVEIVHTDGEEQAALRSGAVDVVTGMAPDPSRLGSTRRTVDVVSMADQYSVYGPALVVTPETLRRRRSALEALLVATIAGWADAIHASPTISPEISSGTTGPERIAAQFRRASDRFGTSDDVRRHGWGWQTVDDWHRLRAALQQGGMLADD